MERSRTFGGKGKIKEMELKFSDSKGLPLS